MNLNNLLKSVLILVVIAFAFMATCPAQEKKIDIKRVPQSVLQSFHKAFPKNEIKNTLVEKEKGKTYYEIESTDSLRHADVLLTGAGEIVEVELTISESELPAGVIKTLNNKFKNFRIHKAEKTTRGKYITYELSFEKNRKKYSVVITPDGRIVK